MIVNYGTTKSFVFRIVIAFFCAADYKLVFTCGSVGASNWEPPFNNTSAQFNFI